MKCNLSGRVRNVTLSKSNGLMPLFEAVVNSIEAIEDRFSSEHETSETGRIHVHIRRQDDLQQLDLGNDCLSERPIESFEVADNGVGFNERNWASFQELDFTRKKGRGCRGVARLTWLKAFKKIRIESWYDEGGVTKARCFNFTAENEVQLEDAPNSNGEVGSRVVLKGLRTEYEQSVEKTADSIAFKLMEHLLWYFVQSAGVPKIAIHDDDADEALYLNDLFNSELVKGCENDSVEIKGANFNIAHVKLRANATLKHSIAYCAARRLVKKETVEIPGLTDSISDSSGPYRYAGYVESPYIDERVNQERTDIDIEEESIGLIADSEVSFSDLRSSLKPLIQNYLGDDLAENVSAGRERLDAYVREVAPQYLPIVSNLHSDDFPVDPGISDARLGRLLHGKKYEIEQTLLKKGERLLQPDLSEDYDDYSERVASYLSELEQVKQSDLASYVAHRRVVIDLLRKAMEIQDDGKYPLERVFHSLLMPAGQTSEDIEGLRGSNLWLLDERLAFHQYYLGSDRPFSSIPATGANGGQRPDLLAISKYKYENPHAFSETDKGHQAAITIVEFKRPMNNKYGSGEETDPISQAYRYLRKIRNGGVLCSTGRHVSNAENLPAHVYVVADLTSSMKERCDNAGLQESPDGMSYFGYNSSPSIRAYTEVIDFQGLLSHAVERNAAFFHQLGMPPAN